MSGNELSGNGTTNVRGAVTGGNPGVVGGALGHANANGGAPRRRPAHLREDAEPLHIAMPVVHTSPIAAPGSADAGGLNVVVTNTAKALARAGHLVDLVTRKTSPDLPPSAAVASGVRIFYLPAGPAHPLAKSASEELIVPFNLEFASWLGGPDGSTVDIIHSHHWFAGLAALTAAHADGLPHVMSFHSLAAPEGSGLAGGEPAESPGRVAGEAFVAAQTDLIVAVSDTERQLILDTYGTAAPITVVEPGVDAELFRPLADDEPLPPALRAVTGGRPYVFFAARLQPLKAPDLLIRALAAIPAEQRPMAVIAGDTSEDFAGYGAELRELARSLGVERDVQFIGPLSRADLAVALRHARALVTPSFSETFGIINLEASASGVPVIAWRASGMRNSVHDGVTGTLVNTREPEDWARAIMRYVSDREARARAGQAGREWALTRSWDTVAAQFVEAYRGLL